MNRPFWQTLHRLFADARQRRRDFRALSHLSDHALKDIGLRRDFGDISPLYDAESADLEREALTVHVVQEQAIVAEQACAIAPERLAGSRVETEGAVMASPLRETSGASAVSSCPHCGAQLA